MCTDEPTKETRRRVPITIAVVVGTATVLIVFWLQLVSDAPSINPRLWNIKSRLIAYHQTNGRLPLATYIDAASGERASWRIVIYEVAVSEGFVKGRRGESPPAYHRHKPWHHPQNLRLQGAGGFYYGYFYYWPGFPRDSMSFATYYKAITGPETAFDADHPRSLAELPQDLILVVRVEKSDTHWMEPGDLTIEDVASPEGQALLLGNDGYAVLFADGAVWQLSPELPFSDLSKFFTIPDASRHNREKLLGPYRR